MRRKFGLSLEKDGGYSKLIVVCSAFLSGFTFGFPAFQGVLTAQWKAEYGFDRKQASLHQTYSQAFFYFGAVIISLFYRRLSPRKWLMTSLTIGLLGYSILYLAFYLPISLFPVCQICMGIVAGLGTGFSFGIICITPQNWLDKTRERFNPYLFIGAPFFITFVLPIGIWLINLYSWSGAYLIMVGIFIQQAIVSVLFCEHPSEINKLDSSEQTLANRMKDIKASIKMPGVLPMILNCAVCSGFIMSGVFTQINNIAMEEGLQVWQASSLVLFSSIPECIFRPVWGELTRCFDTGTLQIVWCFVFMISQGILSLANNYYSFVAGMITFSLGLAGYSGLKFALYIKLVGTDRLTNVLIFDNLLDGLMTIVVPTICNAMSNSKLIFYVNCVAAFLCVLSSVFIRSKLPKEKKEIETKD